MGAPSGRAARIGCAAPRPCRGRAGSITARTGQRRNSGPGTGPSPPRSGPAWRPGPGPQIPSRLGALEGNVPRVHDLPQPFPPDPHRPRAVPGEVGGQLAQTPVRERQPQLPVPYAWGKLIGKMSKLIEKVTAESVHTATRASRAPTGTTIREMTQPRRPA
jgi:hypothetical protein